MTDSARVLLTAGLLSFVVALAFAVRLRRLEAVDPTRIVGELRLAQWAAVTLAALGAAPIGLAVANADVPLAHLDVGFGVGVVVIAGAVLHREPQQALWLASAGFVLHALLALAHRPGWLPPSLAPLWFTIGCATYDVAMAAVCFWATRR